MSTHSRFVHLHVHTHYSLLDGAALIDRLLEKAVACRMPALAITDHGNMFGAVEFYKKATKKGVKPLIGCELYVAEGGRREKSRTYYHLVLLAKDERGYKNLMKLSSLAYLEGMYIKPRVDRELLQRYGEGLVAMSACLKGEIPQALLHGDMERVNEALDFYLGVYGKDDFYLELQDHGIDEQKIVNRQLIELARDRGLKLVVTNDSHYVDADDAFAQEVLLCIQTGATLEEEDRFAFHGDQFYLKTEEEMKSLFPDLEEAYENTLEIAQKCNLELEFGKIHLPKFDVPEGYDENSYLRKLCYEALPERYPDADRRVRERLDFELETIRKMGYSAYFLIVWDFIDYARRNDIAVGPGRGSAAGSIVSYLLGITNLDPIKYGLFFERFLNPERVSMPDIDIDFCFERRGEVIDYVSRKYGKDNVCQIITFGTLSCKAALKDVARVLGIPFNESNNITKAVPDKIGISLQEALEQSSELQEYRRKYPKLFELAAKIEGVARQTGKHAAGVVIAPGNLMDYVPLYKRDDDITTQYTMKYLEDIGLLKMDFLGLKTLTVIRKALDNIRRNRGRELLIDKIPLDDKRTFKLLCNGETVGVFQFESSGFQELIRRVHPNRFEDLIAVIALYRPGPLGSGMVDDFIDGKHGRKEVTYPHPKLESLLEETYGVMLYQEQVMGVANILADYTLGQADQLRRAMGKKIKEEMERHREIFLEGARKNGVDEDTASRIFEMMEKFASYGFNKSHSAAYALVSYQTAYLKANFPQEYMAALLTNEQDDTDKMAFLIEECRRMHIEILPPDINESERDFTVIGEKIRFGLMGIKGLGASVVESILEERASGGPFASFEDFCKRVDLRTVNRRSIESLVKSGAFDGVPPANRARMIAVIDKAVAMGQELQKRKADGQSTLFQFCSDRNIDFQEEGVEYPEIPEFTEKELLNFEKETLGLYLSGHPLVRYRRLIDLVSTTTCRALDEQPIGTDFIVCGIVKNVQKKVSKKTNREFAVLVLEDMSGSFEFLLFDPLIHDRRNVLEEDRIVAVAGKISIRGEEKRIGVTDVVELEKIWRQENWKASVILELGQMPIGKAECTKLKNILLNHRGRLPFYVVLDVEGRKVTIKCGSSFKVKLDSGLVDALEALAGEKKVRLEIKVRERGDSQEKRRRRAAAGGK